MGHSAQSALAWESSAARAMNRSGCACASASGRRKYVVRIGGSLASRGVSTSDRRYAMIWRDRPGRAHSRFVERPRSRSAGGHGRSVATPHQTLERPIDGVLADALVEVSGVDERKALGRLEAVRHEPDGLDGLNGQRHDVGRDVCRGACARFAGKRAVPPCAGMDRGARAAGAMRRHRGRRPGSAPVPARSPRRSGRVVEPGPRLLGDRQCLALLDAADDLEQVGTVDLVDRPPGNAGRASLSTARRIRASVPGRPSLSLSERCASHVSSTVSKGCWAARETACAPSRDGARGVCPWPAARGPHRVERGLRAG